MRDQRWTVQQLQENTGVCKGKERSLSFNGAAIAILSAEQSCWLRDIYASGAGSSLVLALKPFAFKSVTCSRV